MNPNLPSINGPDVHTLRAGHCRTGVLSARDVDSMRELLGRHFDGVLADVFARDLREKTHVLRIWNGESLVGFSTLLAMRTQGSDGPVNLLYSGDTIMSPECWGSPVLAKAWIAMVRDVRGEMPDGRCWWLLLSSGFRTYRFLPVFWREFWPRHDAGTPDEIRALLDAFARERFGGRYDAARGVVRFPFPHRLRGRLAEVGEGRRADPHVSFFLERNPGWRAGDELVCLTEISDDNLTRAGRRMVRAVTR